MNMILYHIFSTLVIVAGVLFTAAVLVGVVWMIRHWDSPQVQDLEAPVREYMLDDEEKREYAEQYQQD